jgi:alpha-tubulin suppressor-like RCC1 family protein
VPTRVATIGATLLVLAVAAVVLPTRAPAGQSSQATAAPVAQVAAGLFHSCALVAAGTQPSPASWPVRCWGFSGDGQVGYANTFNIGDDEAPASAGPVDLGPGRTAKALAAGDYHSCAVLDDGNVRCWGYGNEGQLGYASRAQIGDNESPASVGPVRLGVGRTATAITAGGNHTCALLDDGRVRCWGLGEFGQLGRGSTASIGDGEQVDSVNPVDLDGHLATAVTAGFGHSCAILDDANVRCWGLGGNGQLGYANSSAVLNAADVDAVNIGEGRTAKAITAGAAHTCAILDDGSVRCWGLNEFGQLGYGNTISIGDNEAPGTVPPVDLGQGRTAIAISAGGNHTCAVLDDGTVRCWGANAVGQLGLGNTSNVGDNEVPSAVPTVDIGPGRTAKAIAAGGVHTCARLDDESVRCWGEGYAGRLGYCKFALFGDKSADIGDDELPGTAGPVDLGAGGASCPVVTPPPPPPVAPPPPPAPIAVPPPPPPPVESAEAAALRLQSARARSFRACRAAASAQLRKDRYRATQRYERGPNRTRALSAAARKAATATARCVSRFGRRPGRVTTIAARAGSSGSIVLTFRASGTDGSKGPAAKSYLIKESLRPMRTARDFRRAQPLCKGSCSFDITRIGARITLRVTDLRRNARHYYKIAARDNVSARTGPRSKLVSATTK